MEKFLKGSIIGDLHKSWNPSVNQDYLYTYQFKNGDFLGVIADGVSNCSRDMYFEQSKSEKASKIVTKESSFYFIKHYNSNLSNNKISQIMLRSFDYAKKNLLNWIIDNDNLVNNPFLLDCYHTTLSMVLYRVKDKTLICLNSGDSGLVIHNGKEFKSVYKKKKGGVCGIFYKDYYESNIIKDVKYFILSTDGMLNKLLLEENKINQELVSLFLEEDLYKNTRSLKKILNQLSVNDDKTMIIYRGG